MAHSFLIFDFGTDEDAAQHARHRLEGWKQSFRLDKKLQLKFERKEEEEKEAGAKAGADGDESPKAGKAGAKGKGKAKAGSKSKSGAEAEPETAAGPDKQDIRLIVRLDFSDHEKLSHQRWVERIPADELFKNAKPQVVRAGEPQFKTTSDLFDSLD